MVTRKKRVTSAEPTFTRGEVAKILNVDPQTIANREKAKVYPEPKRGANNYRIYTLNDLLNLQVISLKAADPRPIVSHLYDKGWRDMREIGKMMERALKRQAQI